MALGKPEVAKQNGQVKRKKVPTHGNRFRKRAEQTWHARSDSADCRRAESQVAGSANLVSGGALIRPFRWKALLPASTCLVKNEGRTPKNIIHPYKERKF